MVVGLIIGTDRGALAIGVGIGLAALGGLELAIREHFAGFRSHSSMLAGVPAIATLGLLFYAGPESLEPIARRGDRRGRLRRRVLRVHGDVQAQGGRRVQAALTPSCR